MKPFLLLLASAIALGIHAQGARDWLALRAELDAAYESFQQAVVARNPLAGTSGRNVLVLAQSLHGVDHSETAKLAYSVASALRPANGWETSESDAYAIVEPLVQVMTPMAQMIYSDGRVFRTLPAHVRRIYSRRRSFEQLSALLGAWLDDPMGLLQGTGKRMRHVKLKPGQEPAEAALAALVESAYHDMGERLVAGATRSAVSFTAPCSRSTLMD